MNVEIEIGTKAEQLLFCNICFEFSVLCLCSAGANRAISDSKNGLVILYSPRLHLLSTMLRRWHWKSNALPTRFDLIYTRLDLIPTQLRIAFPLG
jgi:hypothetical protein